MLFAASRTQTQEDLSELLTTAGHGSFFRGWRTELDPAGTFVVDAATFRWAARRMNFTGSVRSLFTGDDSSSLSLAVVDPQRAEVVDKFQQWVRVTFGSPVEMFRALDPEGRGRVFRKDFFDGCGAHGFPQHHSDLREMYECCDCWDEGYITRESVLFLEADPRRREREMREMKVASMEDWRHELAREYLERAKGVNGARRARTAGAKCPGGEASRLAPRPWQARAFEQLPQVLSQRRQERARDVRHRQEAAKAAFFQHVVTAHGNEIRALRRCWDPQRSYNVGKVPLRRYCGQMLLELEFRDLWQVFDRDDDGSVGLLEFSPWRGRILAQFKHWAARNPELGSCTGVWDSRQAVSARSTRQSGKWTGNSEHRMRFGNFTGVLRALGWPGVEDKEERVSLLTSLDLHGCGFLTRADLEWLDGWDPPEWVCAEPDPEAWEKLRELLLERYDHPLMAWRNLLDRNNSNKISWSEFEAACHEVRFEGNVAGVWRHLDNDSSGYISMREYDLPSAQVLGSFKAWADRNFGGVVACLRALDEDRSGYVTFSELKRATSKTPWYGDVRLLYNCLDGVKAGASAVRDKATGRRAVGTDELAFLDSWIFEDGDGDGDDDDERKAITICSP